MKLALSLLFLTGCILAQDPETAGLQPESIPCQNGASGSLTLFAYGLDGPFQGIFTRVGDCDAENTYFMVPVDSCRVQKRTQQQRTFPQSATPSSSTPVISYLDAGPALYLRAVDSEQEVKIERTILGAGTSYFRGANYTSTSRFLRNGKYLLRAEGGRDIAAFEREFELRQLAITAPVSGSTLNASTPPTIEWTSADQAVQWLIIATVTGPETEGAYDVDCRVSSETNGRFTIPADAWNLIPAAARDQMSISLLPWPNGNTRQQLLEIPELDHGLAVELTEGASITFRLQR